MLLSLSMYQLFELVVWVKHGYFVYSYVANYIQAFYNIITCTKFDQFKLRLSQFIIKCVMQLSLTMRNSIITLIRFVPTSFSTILVTKNNTCPFYLVLIWPKSHHHIDPHNIFLCHWYAIQDLIKNTGFIIIKTYKITYICIYVHSYWLISLQLSRENTIHPCMYVYTQHSYVHVLC